MLREYLQTAQDVLEAKKDIYNIKSQRLVLAQDEYEHLNNALATLNASRTSLCSSSSNVSTKYDPDLLKSEVAGAKSRVSRIKIELEQIQNEMKCTQKGVEALTMVEQKITSHSGGGYNIGEAQAIIQELRNIQVSLQSGEKEKVELMQSLAKLKDDLTRLQLRENDSSADASSLDIFQYKLSTASQTDLSCGDGTVPVGTKLAEMAKIRLKYDESRKKVQNIQKKLADLEEKIQPGELESDKDRLLLFQEKEQLLRELRSITPRMRSRKEMCDIQAECQKLEQDLHNALEVSNRTISDRLRLHEEKQFLLQQLRDALKQMTQLESQLKTLSASTLSVSSSSSLGSLSTTSSKGSLSSGLSFTDIYGGPKTSVASEKAIDMVDLQKRVARLLKINNDPVSICTPSPSRSQPSLSPRSSLSSVSPPMSPMYENIHCLLPPPSYEQTEKERKQKHQNDEEESIINRSDSYVNIDGSESRDSSQRLPVYTDLFDTNNVLNQEFDFNRICRYSSYNDNNTTDILSPISETPPPPQIFNEEEVLLHVSELSRTSSSCTNTTRSVSAAVSDESVAGDSGVFEASNRKKSLGTSNTGLSDRRQSNTTVDDVQETTQVLVKLVYVFSKNVLNICLGKAKYLNVLGVPDEGQIYMKIALLPPAPENTQIRVTKIVKCSSAAAIFDDCFDFDIALSKLYAKTLQISIWCKNETSPDLCYGYTQISLADFNPQYLSQRWYNILSLTCLMMESKLLTKQHNGTENSYVNISRLCATKEESSDDSTVISSQTSTLTRNQELKHINVTPKLDFQELVNCLENTPGYTSEDSDSDKNDDIEEEEDIEDICLNDKLDIVIEDLVAECQMEDKQTNTECTFYPEHLKQIKLMNQSSNFNDEQLGAIRRSQTFSPSVAVSKRHYSCKLNRSDSDSAMPLYRKGSNPFQRNSVERRSLRFRKQSGSLLALSKSKSNNHVPPPVRTSLDLELDLQAQHTKLDNLNSELQVLRDLRDRLEVAKENGDANTVTRLMEDTGFQNLMAQAEDYRKGKTPEEKRIEKMLRKISREIYRLRKSKAGNGKPDMISFKEKMAFFTKTNPDVLVLSTEEPPILPKENNDSNAENFSVRIGNDTETGNSKDNIEEEEQRYSYVVDRILGVEV
ncbi:protein kibra isoform X2 [Agrilus planipennis]|nr:protein kibra isoform X2 [Agrilus planipennis]